VIRGFGEGDTTRPQRPDRIVGPPSNRRTDRIVCPTGGRCAALRVRCRGGGRTGASRTATASPRGHSGPTLRQAQDKQECRAYGGAVGVGGSRSQVQVHGRLGPPSDRRTDKIVCPTGSQCAVLRATRSCEEEARAGTSATAHPAATAARPFGKLPSAALRASRTSRMVGPTPERRTGRATGPPDGEGGEGGAAAGAWVRGLRR